MAHVGSNVEDKTDSETLVRCYNISPVKSEDVSSEYVSNTTSANFTLTKDNAVCWRVNSRDITLSGASAGDSVYINVIPYNSNEVPAKEIHLTAVKIAGTTLRVLMFKRKSK